MDLHLSQFELRLIGCLIEKSITTPDHYPLSLNSLTNACNQKSNRDPVLTLTEFEVQDTLDLLTDRNLILSESERNSRVLKYKHRFCNSKFSELQFSSQELAIICILFLRGPQTPGELRTRTNRLCDFDNVVETEAALIEMGKAAKGPFVVKLPREPGKRESRYAHCFTDQNYEDIVSVNEQEENSISKSNPDRITEMEEKIELMQLEIDELKTTLDDLI